MILNLETLWNDIASMFLRIGDPNVVISRYDGDTLRVSHRHHKDIIRIKLGIVPKLVKKGTQFVDESVQGITLDMYNKDFEVILSMQTLDAKDTVAAIYGMVVLTYDSEE